MQCISIDMHCISFFPIQKMLKASNFKELVGGHGRYLVLRKKILWLPNDQVEVFSMSYSAQKLPRSTAKPFSNCLAYPAPNGQPLWKLWLFWKKSIFDFPLHMHTYTFCGCGLVYRASVTFTGNVKHHVRSRQHIRKSE